MMNSMDFLKYMAVKFLPSPVLFFVKKHYYAYVIRSFWEPDAEPIKNLVKPGDFVIDLGANIGWYSNVLAGLVGKEGRVYSIEPIPDTFRLLSTIIKKLGLKNIQPLNYAISEKDGSAIMEIPLHGYGGKNFYMARIISRKESGGSAKQHTVSLRSLDSLFLDVADKVTFIKCDVEGHELAVIKGASGFFQKTKPAMFIEVGGSPEKSGSSASELFDILKQYGYSAYFYDGQKLQARFPGHWSVNYFFLQPAHLKQVSQMLKNQES